MVFLRLSLGDLGVLFLDFVDLGDVDECDVFLAIDFFEFKGLVDGVAVGEVDPLANERQFNHLSFTAFSHYIYF